MATPGDLAGLSTILVATVQEVKDRVAQIEFVFCARIFPLLQRQGEELGQLRGDKNEISEREKGEILRRFEEEKRNLEVEKGEILRRFEEEKKVLEVEKDEILRRFEEEKKVSEVEIRGLRKEKDDILTKCKAEKRVLVAEIEGLRQEKDEISRRSENEKVELEERLVREVGVKEEELVVEMRKRRRLVDGWKELRERYKQVSSQYRFLLKKTGLVVDEDETVEDVGGGSPMVVTPIGTKCIQDSENPDEDIIPLDSQENKETTVSASLEKLEAEEESRSGKSLNTPCSKITPLPFVNAHVSKTPAVTKQTPLSGTKRSKSYWRDTRAKQEHRGLDPHDDFFDTPIEKFKENSNKGLHAEHEVSVRTSKAVDPNVSSDKMQEVEDQNAQTKKPFVIQKAGNKSYKYVEPVRKKADREILKGVECKQCKKFYDAVLPNGDKDGSNGKSIRCEHHDGVSRHRYRYAPPLTPEGFWNIGFDSEM